MVTFAAAAAAVWLSAAALAPRRLPRPVLLAAAAAATSAHLLWFGALSAGLAAGLTAILTVGVVAVRLVTARTWWAVVPVLLLLPAAAWWLLLPGLAAGIGWAAVRLHRTAGAGYLNMVTMETLASIGSTSGPAIPLLGVRKPDLSRLPAPDLNSDPSTPFGQAQRATVPLLRLLAVGLWAGCGILLLAGNGIESVGDQRGAHMVSDRPAYQPAAFAVADNPAFTSHPRNETLRSLPQ